MKILRNIILLNINEGEKFLKDSTEKQIWLTALSSSENNSRMKKWTSGYNSTFQYFFMKEESELCWVSIQFDLENGEIILKRTVLSESLTIVTTTENSTTIRSNPEAFKSRKETILKGEEKKIQLQSLMQEIYASKNK